MELKLSEVLELLTDWFPVEDHKERTIKGGSKWYYIPHQAIRDRLNEVCPGDWSTTYEGPHIIDGEPIYHCKLTICGITRTGIGDKSNEPSPYGTAAQRAFRKAFVDAAEQFGIGAYLDEQTSEKTKRNFIRHMQASGNGKAAVHYQQQQQSQGNGNGKPEPPKTSPATATASPPSRHLATASVPPPAAPKISEAQLKRLWAIARTEGNYTDAGMRELLKAKGFESSRDITIALYDEICTAAGDPIMGKMYNDRAVAESQAF